MKRTFSEIEAAAAALPGVSRRAAASAAWLQACDYAGLSILLEAVNDDRKNLELQRDALGLDLQNVSCVFVVDAVADQVRQHGRLFLRNVRHGLYLVPLSIASNWAIGCPIDPAFALGGPREKNPYTEKLAVAEQQGITVDEELWQAVLKAGNTP